MNAVCCAVIRLRQAAGGQIKQTLVADEGDGGGLDAAHGIHRGINILAGAGLQGQRHLHILYRVLVEREHLTANFGASSAAAEVQNLVPFVDRAAGLHVDSATAGDEAPSIQCAAGLHVDGTAGLHFDGAVRPDDAALTVAGSRKVLAADADGCPLLKGNGAARRHGQRPEDLGTRLRGGGSRRRGVAGLCLVKRNQQGDAARDSVAPRDCAVGGQRNGGGQLFLCLLDRVVQLVKALAAGLKECHVLTDELRRNGAVAFDVQRGLGCGADVLSVGHIIPAHELIARRRGRRHLIGDHGALGVGVGLGDGLPVHGIAAVLGGLERHGGGHIGHQRHVGHRDLRGGVGAAGLDIDLDGGVRRKLFREFAACGDHRTIHLNCSAVLLNDIVEGQRRLCGSLVGDGQRGAIVCIAACSARAGSCADNARTIGRPRILRVAGEAQADVFIRQTGHVAFGRCKRRHGDIGQQRQDQAECQHQ